MRFRAPLSRRRIAATNDAGTSSAITVRQCASSALCLLVFEYALRMDLSRFFLALFAFEAAFVWADA